MALKPDYNDSIPVIPVDNSVYGLEFFYEYRNFHSTQLHRVEFLKKAYMFAYFEITKGQSPPVTLTHTGEGKDDWEETIIQGQSLSFKFYINQNDIDDIEPIFESEYHDYLIKYFIDGELEFIGWLQPENLSKNFSTNEPNVAISITAYDGLTDLEDEDFLEPATEYLEGGKAYTGRVTILEILKTVLSRTGIPLDFSIQLNTWEGTTAPPEPAPLEILGTEDTVLCAITTEDGKLILIS